MHRSSKKIVCLVGCYISGKHVSLCLISSTGTVLVNQRKKLFFFSSRSKGNLRIKKIRNSSFHIGSSEARKKCVHRYVRRDSRQWTIFFRRQINQESRLNYYIHFLNRINALDFPSISMMLFQIAWKLLFMKIIHIFPFSSFFYSNFFFFFYLRLFFHSLSDAGFFFLVTKCR